ncbi:hypothetical protein GOV04_03710 [Candidatus Woesearchaeota archaeon]|nr:hypothetical protein [Candidatus Woesearchaeota archaeon]
MKKKKRKATTAKKQNDWVFALTEDLMPLKYVLYGILFFGFAMLVFTNLTFVEVLQLMIAIFLFFFLAGYSILLNFDFDTDERIILGIPLSVALIGLTVYYLNVFFGIAMSAYTVILVIIFYFATGFLIKNKSLLKK